MRHNLLSLDKGGTISLYNFITCDTPYLTVSFYGGSILAFVFPILGVALRVDDYKYIMLLSGRLQKFKRKSPVLFNFRCPLCGDSLKKQNKARGYIYQRAGSFFFTCHNCLVTIPFYKFLKQVDSGLYEEYLSENFNERYSKRKTEKTNSNATQKTCVATSILKTIAELLPRHPARKYLVSRKIPEKYFKELFYCPEFKAWTNEQIPDKFEDMSFDEERIIIPLIDPSGKMFGFQGRSLDDSEIVRQSNKTMKEASNKIRYISIILDETKPKIYGWNKVDFNRKFFTLEGPFDSMFLSNAIATLGGKLTSELMKIGCNLDNAVVVYDNEPRNEAIVSNVHKAIMNNFRVVIWPSNHLYKDINEWILGGIKPLEIENYLKKWTYQGLDAELEFAKWRKI